MKILCCGDTHITTKKPKNRTDDYVATVLSKFSEELDIAVDEGCCVVLLPGDVFDCAKESHEIVQRIIYIIKDHPSLKILAVAGQHDQHYHNPDLTGTALATLLAADVVTLLTEHPLMMGDCAFYGSSWKGDIPEITLAAKTNVLILHKMIINEKLWAAQEGHTWSNHILMKNKFDLICSGDNHQQFTATVGKKHLVNMGSMMRSTIAQVNHQPAVTVYDTNTREIEIIDLTVKPLGEVMCLDKATKEKEHNKMLEAFVESLKDSGEHGEESAVVKLDFVAALEEECQNEENGITEEVSDIIFECVGAE